MMQETTIEQELNNIIYQKVKRDPYPEPIPAISDSALRQELKDLKAERIPRPATKAEYLALLETLNDDIEDIAAENRQIAFDNAAARKAVDDKYAADIAAAKLDETNIGEALCACIDHDLEKTVWYVTKDSGLTQTQQAKADKWRTDLMNIPFTSANISTAIATYNTLKATKPAYALKWTQR